MVVAVVEVVGMCNSVRQRRRRKSPNVLSECKCTNGAKWGTIGRGQAMRAVAYPYGIP